MQKLTYSFFLFVIAPLLLLFSCSRDDIDKHGPIDPDSMLVTFELVGSSPATYGLSHEDELSVSEVKLLLFNINNELIDPIPVKGSLSDVSPGKIKVEAKVQRGGYGNIMLLANSKSILEAATLTENMTYEQVREKLLMNFTGKWVAENGAAGIPMYGETGFVNVKNVDGNNFSASLTRMLCRVDLAVDVKVQATFNLTSVRVYNREVAGVLAAPKIAGDPLMPTTPSKIKEPLIYQGDEITPTGKAIAGEIYLMESLVKGSPDINRLDGAVCLVVGGFYTHNGIVSAKELFYRVDFSKSHSDTELHPRHYYDLVRSHHYKINIISVSGPGEEDPDVALEKEISFIDVVVTDWGTGGTIDGAVDGQYTLRLSQGEFNLFSQAYIDGSTDNKLTVSSNHPDGWWIEKITDESDMEIPSDGWLSTTLPLKAPQMSDKTFSLLLEPNTDPSSRIGYIYIQSGPRMQYKLKVKQRNLLQLNKIIWDDYDGVSDGDTGLTSMTVELLGLPPQTSAIGINGEIISTLIQGDEITKLTLTYKDYAIEIPATDYTIDDLTGKIITVTNRSPIGKPIHLDKIRTQVNSENSIIGDYIQVADINLSSYPNWEPIGTPPSGNIEKPFIGSYDGGSGDGGKGFKILNLKIVGSLSYSGLFGVALGADFKKIHIGSGSSVNGKIAVGAICGSAKDTQFTGCSNMADISGESNIGGICGNLNGVRSTINNCHNIGGVKGTSSNIGGICGINGIYYDGGKIENCTNDGTIEGDDSNIGGICGNNDSGVVWSCKNNGSVTGSRSWYIGGIIGYNICHEKWEGEVAVIKNCLNFGAISGGEFYMGGICGITRNEILLTNCHNEGSVSGGNSVGGICGENGEQILSASGYIIELCTNSAPVTGTGANIGGICGYNIGIDATITNCKNLLGGNISGVQYVGGIIGVQENKATISGSTNAATVTATNTYAGGICGQNKGANIETCINDVGGNVTGVGNYTGGICGQNTVRSDNAIISGCENKATISSEGMYTGGIAGYNDGEIKGSCENSGWVEGEKDYIGGICGVNTGSGTISDCTTTSESSVLGIYIATKDAEYIGGICGNNTLKATIERCTNNGDVSAISDNTPIQPPNNAKYVGGICGFNSGKIRKNCLNTGGIYGNNATYTGGICGNNYAVSGNASITESINEGAVSSNRSHTGGISGNNQSNDPHIQSITHCINRGKVSSNGLNLGGITGDNNARGVITDCTNEIKGTITGRGDYVAGIAGWGMNGPEALERCNNYANVTGRNNVGGIYGSNPKGMVKKCVNTGDIIGTGDVGGICGITSDEAVIDNCTNSGNISRIGADQGSVGGICGSNGGTIQNLTTNSGDVTGSPYYHEDNEFVGGICGSNQIKGIVKNCFNSGSVKSGTAAGTGGNGGTGGIGGYNEGIIESCENSGPSVEGNNYVGGVCGISSSGATKACINKASVSGVLYYIGGIVGISQYTSTTVACYNLGSVQGTAVIGAVVGAGVAPENCYFGENAQASFVTTPGSSTRFGDGAWPDPATMPYWTSVYWSEIGGWNSGSATIEYPELAHPVAP